ncbi:MAG: acyl-CoA synthetase [Silicimonas sp.]|nr:acyl-CoA synthetase [Silicimonas sp.]
MLAVDDQRPCPKVPARLNLARHVLFSNSAPDDAIALTVLGLDTTEVWRFGELRHSVLATAAGFVKSGLSVGDRILMRIGNSPDFPVVFLGAIAAGLIPVPTSAALGPSEITRIADMLSPDAIVAGPDIPLPDHRAPLLYPDQLAKAKPLTDLADTLSDDPAYIVFTSGTSGGPMGVVHAHRAIWARGMMFNGWYDLRSDDRMLHAGAFNWTFTLGTGLMDPWTKGASALVLAPGTPIDALPQLAREHEATIIAGAPGVFRHLLKSPMPTLPKLRHVLVAGEKLPETLRQSWKSATHTDMHEAFGQTECSTFISGSPTRPAPAGTLGFTQPGRAVAVLGPDGPVLRGELGAIAVHASDPGLRLGYLDDTRPPEGEWVLTGDMGVMRPDGAIEYHGRNDDILTAGGFRIAPSEIEDAMLTHPDLEEAAAVDHALTPETTVIALHYTGKKLEDDVLSTHAAKHLARYKQPRVFIHAQSLPRNANGKLLRKTLRAANENTS